MIITRATANSNSQTFKIKPIAELLKKYNITITQLPKIYVTDAVVKALDAKEGQVLKVIRKSQTAGTAVYYRLVVKD